ncbi:MAG: hypothetical protein O2780_20055 [Proteobacteria bacterium]|nr:hypothetical protein [Pseudomonadota bacterium]
MTLCPNFCLAADLNGRAYSLPKSMYPLQRHRRPDADAARIGQLGYSVVGHVTFIPGAVESRFKTTVARLLPVRRHPPLPVISGAIVC